MSVTDTATEAPWLPTACILCECNCGITVQLGGEGGRHLARFRGDDRHPTSQGYTCEKPRRLDHYQHGPDRVLKPLRRRPDGTFEEIDWQTAIGEVAEKLMALRDEHSGDTILYYGGGGQGNHLPGAYATATRRALGSRYRSSALAQEKTGEFWVSHEMLGTATRGDFEHCDVALFIGKNPWFSHGIPRARVTLKEIAKDPERTMIVIDPRVTKTAELADIHLQVRPGTDAWLLAAMVAVLLEEQLTEPAFLDAHTDGLAEVEAVLGQVDIARYCAIAGIDEAQVREAVRLIGRAGSVATFEDLGVQMNRHSTLVSYLHRLLWLLTGNLGKRGSQYVPTVLAPIANGKRGKDTKVTGARIIGNLLPCNSVAEEILADHPDRFRGMLCEAANPAHSLADSPMMREALEALELLVVIDVAMTETAALADYVLPASTQFEKAEATFFNFEFPRNAFQLRPALMPPPDGPLSEAEIHARLVEAMGALEGAPTEVLRGAAEQGLEAYAMAFLQHVVADARFAHMAPVLLYRTLGPTLPPAQREGAIMLGMALRAAATSPDSLARAGFDGPPPVAAATLLQAILDTPSGVVFAEDRWEDVLDRVGGEEGRIHLALPELLEAAAGLADGPEDDDPAFPFVLSAGERRSFTANTIIRDPAWRRKDARGALRMNGGDAASLGIASGDAVRVRTRRGAVEVVVDVSDTMQPGHLSLPNGMGLTTPLDEEAGGGVAVNELTETDHRDPFVGTPFHKRVPAMVEPVG